MKQIAAIAGMVLGLVAGGANATLYSRDNGNMVYDDVLKITWLADWNYARTSGYAGASASGKMNWAAANTWANTLVYGGYSDWRLPTSLNQDGTGPCDNSSICKSSEMGYMFYQNWGATYGSDYSTGTNFANLALFKNVQSNPVGLSDYYWSSTAAPCGIADCRWIFKTSDGLQTYGTSDNAFFAVAVRPGDVGASVPEPGTVVLLSLGLGALGLMARRKQA